MMKGRTLLLLVGLWVGGCCATAPAPDPHQVNRGVFFGPEEYPIVEPDDTEEEQE
jgi:hypothetical protein